MPPVAAGCPDLHHGGGQMPDLSVLPLSILPGACWSLSTCGTTCLMPLVCSKALLWSASPCVSGQHSRKTVGVLLHSVWPGVVDAASRQNASVCLGVDRCTSGHHLSCNISSYVALLTVARVLGHMPAQARRTLAQ